MRNMTALLCLTIAMILGSIGNGWSADTNRTPSAIHTTTLPKCPVQTDVIEWSKCWGSWWSYSGGAEYTGEWQDGKFHGEGTYRFKNGLKLRGKWINGNFLYPPETKHKYYLTVPKCCPLRDKKRAEAEKKLERLCLDGSDCFEEKICSYHSECAREERARAAEDAGKLRGNIPSFHMNCLDGNSFDRRKCEMRRKKEREFIKKWQEREFNKKLKSVKGR